MTNCYRIEEKSHLDFIKNDSSTYISVWVSGHGITEFKITEENLETLKNMSIGQNVDFSLNTPNNNERLEFSFDGEMICPKIYFKRGDGSYHYVDIEPILYTNIFANEISSNVNT